MANNTKITKMLHIIGKADLKCILEPWYNTNEKYEKNIVLEYTYHG